MIQNKLFTLMVRLFYWGFSIYLKLHNESFIAYNMQKTDEQLLIISFSLPLFTLGHYPYIISKFPHVARPSQWKIGKI